MNPTLQVRKDRLAEARLLNGVEPALAEGEVRVRVESFALTANNITYAAFGESMNYWQFFPTGDAGWGIVPVWGFGSVVQSLHPGVAVGERLYGYWPMARSTTLRPTQLSARAFSDGAAHREPLHAVYNQYLRTAADPFYTRETEDWQSILRPLFATAWLIDDFMADNAFFGAAQVLLSSASSKTAYATAFHLRQRPGIEVVGLTSAANRAFCESLGCYARVVAYDEVESLAGAAPTVYIDYAGNVDLRRRIHRHFTDLRYSCSVGGTHVEHLGGAKDLPGPRPILFFAPAQRKKREQEWGGAELGRRVLEAWLAFRGQLSPGALRVEHHAGPDAVLAAYSQVLGGRSAPDTGHILSLA